METTTTETAAPSTAASESFAIPQDPKANLEWRKTGEMPAATERRATPQAASTPAKPASAAPSKEEPAETAAASAPAPKQEATSAAAIRLNELLADLKAAGLSPTELKTFKREAAAAPAQAAPETTAQPQGAPPNQLVEPKEPTQADFPVWEDFQAAQRKYVKDFATYTAKLAVQQDRELRANEAQQATLRSKIADAKARYGETTEATIGEATRAIHGDETIPLVVRQLISESPVLVDVMYVLGSKPEELASFVALTKSDPGKAIRKFALMEHLVEQELAKPGAAATPAVEGTARDETGKFVAPAKIRTAAPAPPEELSTRGSAPPDPIDAAVRNNDFATFKAEEDRRDLRKRRGT